VGGTGGLIPDEKFQMPTILRYNYPRQTLQTKKNINGQKNKETGF
jgi:hypothetical protein